MIAGAKPSITAIEGYLKIFQAFPAMHSKYVKAEGGIITPLCDLSDNALNLIADSDINFVFQGYSTGGRIVNSSTSKDGLELRRGQYSAFSDENFCLDLSRWVIGLATDEKIRLAEEMGAGDEVIDEMKLQRESIGKRVKDIPEVGDYPTWRKFIFSPEASLTQLYLSALGEFCEDNGWPFGGRTRRPAEDAVNAMLNYGYAILKSTIDGVLLAAGFDPYVGFLHTLRPGRESLSLDVIEPFRQPVVDRAILSLITSGSIDSVKDFDYRKDEVRIEKNTKSALQTVISTNFFFSMDGPSPHILRLFDVVDQLTQKVCSYVADDAGRK